MAYRSASIFELIDGEYRYTRGDVGTVFKALDPFPDPGGKTSLIGFQWGIDGIGMSQFVYER